MGMQRPQKKLTLVEKAERTISQPEEPDFFRGNTATKVSEGRRQKSNYSSGNSVRSGIFGRLLSLCNCCPSNPNDPMSRGINNNKDAKILRPEAPPQWNYPDQEGLENSALSSTFQR